MHQDWNNHCNLLTAIAEPFRFHFMSEKIFQFLLGNSKIQRICVHFWLFQLVCVTGSSEKILVELQHSQFCVLKIEEPDKDWCVQLVLFSSSISYNELLKWSSFLKSLLLLAACVFTSLRYFVAVCRLRSIMWWPSELLFRSFTVSATTMQFGFLSFFLLASIAYCTKLLKHFFGWHSMKRCFFLTTSHSCR